MAVYEVVAVTGSVGTVAIGHRWALRRVGSSQYPFVLGDNGKPLTWATLRDVDYWLGEDRLQDGAVVIWPVQVLMGAIAQ